ncbi:hypothetical protein [Edaphovirga cremea]|uniref:hypothetical protein n=1 Tax=Edaphovirga cremea TaxID=2267246 RepID=UPI003988E759
MKEELKDEFIDFTGIDSNIKLDRADFLRIAEPSDSGTIDFNFYAGWLKIMPDGLYVNIIHENEVDLTPEEAAVLSAHPTGNLSEPVLKFPFTVKELIYFLGFIDEEGLDFPISKERFDLIIKKKQQKISSLFNATTKTIDNTKCNNFDKINKQRSERKEEIKEIASSIWSIEENKSIRIGEMAKKINQHMNQKGMEDIPTESSIRSMIREVAPSLAKKPGRPKKT